MRYSYEPPQHIAAPRYDNRYVLDVTVAAWLLLIGAFLFALEVATTLYIDYENSCSAYLCGSLGTVLASAIIFLIATCLLVFISYPEELEYDLACVEEFGVVDSIEKRKSFGERFLWGSRLLIFMWLQVLALVPLYVLVIWSYTTGDLSLAYFISYFLILVTISLLVIFWIAATFPENMIKNDGRGSSYFYDLFLSCCWGARLSSTPDLEEECTCNNFWSKHAGSDFLVGSWVFFGLAGIGLVVAIYYTYEQWTNVLIYLVLISAVLVFVGSALFVSSSYPGQFFSRFWWCTITCQKTEQELRTNGGRSGGRRGGEDRRLL